MPRLIDADAFEVVAFEGKSDEFLNGATAVLAMIDATPTIDAVEVVRCRDCKYRDGTPGQPNIQCGQMHDDDFCSYGERKEGAE